MSPKRPVESFPDVPRWMTPRVGDKPALESPNNSMLYLGTDRAKNGPATPNDGLGLQKKTGAALLVVGRKDPSGNPDHKMDDAFLYLSMKTKMDENLQTSFETNDIGPAAILKADHLRFVFRKNLKVSNLRQGKNTDIFLNDDVLHINMSNNKVKVSLDVNSSDSSIVMNVQDKSIITIKSDGTVTVAANGSVTVETPNLTIQGTRGGTNMTTIKGQLMVMDVSTLLGGTVTPKLAATAMAAGAGAVLPTNPTDGIKMISDVNVTGKILATGDITTTGGEVKADQIALKQHKHSGVKTDTGTSGPPTP